MCDGRSFEERAKDCFTEFDELSECVSRCSVFFLLCFLKLMENTSETLQLRRKYSKAHHGQLNTHKMPRYDAALAHCNNYTHLRQCYHVLNTLRPRQDGRHFADDIFKCIFLNENALIANKISLKFVSKGPITNIPSLVQLMAWRRPGDKSLSEPMMVSLPTHICVTRPQWVKCLRRCYTR